MNAPFSEYVIVGGGLAGASAIEGIREIDHDRPITLIGAESHLPYDRPPLSKKLWSGNKRIEEIFLFDQAFYERNGVTLLPGRRVAELDRFDNRLRDNLGGSRSFGKLLIATGGVPRTLPIPGGDIDGVYYYRNLDDYLRLRGEATEGRSAVVVGGGFIGSEMAAALATKKVAVTMIFPAPYPCNRVFPKDLGLAVRRTYEQRGIRIMSGERPTGIERHGRRFVVRTGGGETVEADVVIAGIGIRPAVDLAASAGLSVGDGIVVDQYLQTSRPNVYAAGDNARFPFAPHGGSARLEHWDNARGQGKAAGRNMAGAHEAYAYLPYFFSDLFDLGYEAVGDVDPRMQVAPEWQTENQKGVVYYLRDSRVKGVMLCNVWDQVPRARELILENRRVIAGDLRGALAERRTA
jgi:3-phenylpropionate/trans-cinnamate dioxygenase ferredoxin reductase component